VNSIATLINSHKAYNKGVCWSNCTSENL